MSHKSGTDRQTDRQTDGQIKLGGATVYQTVTINLRFYVIHFMNSAVGIDIAFPSLPILFRPSVLIIDILVVK